MKRRRRPGVVPESDLVVDRLDTIIALLKVGYSEHIAAVRKRINDDPILRELMETAGSDGMASAALVDAVMKKTNSGARTVQGRLADLVALGALKGTKSGTSISYRSTGLF